MPNRSAEKYFHHHTEGSYYSLWCYSHHLAPARLTRVNHSSLIAPKWARLLPFFPEVDSSEQFSIAILRTGYLSCSTSDKMPVLNLRIATTLTSDLFSPLAWTARQRRILRPCLESGGKSLWRIHGVCKEALEPRPVPWTCYPWLWTQVRWKPPSQNNRTMTKIAAKKKIHQQRKYEQVLIF